MVEPILIQAFPPHAIAIVGLAGRFPGARDLDGFWSRVRAGVETLETLSDAALDAAGVPEALRSNPHFVRKGAALDGAELFDAGFFGYSPREAQSIDPQHRIFLECAWEALEYAGYAGGVSQKSVGVYAGASMNTYLPAQILNNPQLTEALGQYQLMLGNDKDFLCTRVSYKLDLHGPSMTIQTACSTSLVAVVVACRALSQGDCDLALAGGISVAFPQRAGYLYQEGMILSPDGHCRPFDADARGTRAGEGAGIVVLKRLADALADRDTIHAVIRGAAINNDGAGKAGYTAPSVDGQIEAIAMAQTLAGIDPRTISYIEAHGTATPLGDPIEIAALTRVFRASTPDVGFCRLGSIKANIGHLDVAAGVAGLINTVLALKHREIPPLANFRTPNPQLDLDRSPFVASAQGGPWTTGGAPRRAGVNSMGIGGTNAHVVLEEAPHATPLTPHRYAHLLVLSAKTATALDRATSNLVECLDARDDLSLADVEWTLQVGRQDFAHRRMVVARTSPQAADLLRQPTLAPVLTGIHEGGPRPVAFLFSGQGSQFAGMGTGLYRTERVYREAIDRCAELLAPHLGLDIRKIILGDGGDSAINATRLTQPALFATEYALALLWMQWGITPKAMLGHSIGEYVAAHLAAVMSLEDVLAVVAARGRLMQELPPGGMAAVYLPAPELERWLEGGVEIAAVNAPALCTVSGPGEIIANLVKRLEGGGVQAMVLHTSHAFHSAMMEPALAPFTELLEGITLSLPTLPYVSNVTGTWITGEQATSLAYYATHLRRAVQFEAGIRTLAVDPTLFLLEVGPGNALTSMARMTVGKNRAKHVFPSLPHAREQRADGEAMLEAAGCLWLSGAKVDWQRMHAGAGRRRVPLPTYPFERQRYWVKAAPVTAPRSASDGQRLAASVDELLYAPSWMRDDSLASRSVRLQGNWMVLADRGPLAEAVMGELRNVGAAPILVERGAEFQRLETSRFRVRPGVAEDIGALVRETGGLSGPIAGAIVLWSVMEPDTRATALAASPYSALIALSEGLETSASVSPLHVIAACVGAESVLDEPVLRPSAALAFGPVLVLPTEVQGLRMRSVDLDIREGTINIALAARALVEEAASHDTEVFVARRAGRRWVRRFERLDLPPAEATALPLKSRGAYLITGGLGGIGLKLATWLATVASARLLLTARTALPPRADWNAVLAQHGADDRNAGVILAIKEIEQAGGEVVTAAADAADDSAMAAAIKEARTRWGALDGVIHAAGIAGHNKFAFRKNGQEVSAVLAPKVDGLDVLVRLLGDTPLDFVALMSSISSIVGKPGLCDYAAANSVLDAFAESALRPAVWRQVVALNWDAWRDVGMAARHVVPEAQRAEWRAFLQSSIVPAVAVEAFARVLASGRSRVIITPYDLVCAVERTRWQDSELATASRSPDARVPELTSAVRARPALSSPFEAPGSEIERRLAAIWTELLGIAAWQRRTQDPDQLAAQLEWWERNLAGIPQLCAFSPDLLPTATRAEGSTRVFPWNAELSGAFRLLVREEGTTVYMGLLTALAVVLQAHTGLNDIVLGSPMGIRERPEFETMIGPFVNLLVLRLNLTDDPTFVELLGRARDAVLDAHAHREVPFEMLIERLKPVRTFTRSPLFQVAVVQHNASSDHAEAISAGGAIHDMTWFVREVEDGFEGAIEFRTDLYAAETIDRIDAHLGAVLLAAVRDRRCRISEISLLTSLERQHVVEKFNATAAETDGATFAAQFERQAAVTAEACAVRFESAELTYGALNRRANQLARRLRFLGIGPGVLVGLSLERSLDMVVALLGIQKAGGAYVPLDPDLPKKRLEFMLVDSGVAVLVTAGETGSGLDIPEGMYLLDLEAEAAALDGMDATNLEGFVGPQDVAYVIYTSGSTGRPKGVAVSHGALSNFLGAMKRAPTLAASDVLAATTTISFDIAALELYLPLLVGARVELISREMAADGAALAEQLSVSEVTVLQATPVTWRQLVDVGWRGRQGFRALCGGETLPRDLADALLERVQELWNLFGPTETTIWSTAERVERGTEPISIGRPIANTQIYILDHAGEPAPIGIPGEIWIGGAGVATRYHRRPELTAERFVPDRFTSQPGARLYRTGDLGRWGADGRLYHLGRLDHQLKIHGIRIEPGEIETVLRAHSAVRQVVIIAREVGPGSRRLVAYVVYEAGKDLTVSEVRGYLRGKLPDYMVPSVVVTLDSVPLTPNGKVDRMSLPDPFKNTLRTAASREPPAPGTEQQIAQIWQDILRIDRISAEDNFFELGGHSLLSLRVAAAVEKQIGCRMDPRTLFFQTLRQVATGVRRDATAARARGR